MNSYKKNPEFCTCEVENVQVLRTMGSVKQSLENKLPEAGKSNRDEWVTERWKCSVSYNAGGALI